MLCPREPGKKNAPESASPLPSGREARGFGGSPDSLETFLERLRDRCTHDGKCDGLDRSRRIQVEAERARALADELGILKSAPFSWEELQVAEPSLWIGSEHFVDFSPADGRYHKTTVPPVFGRTPAVLSHPVPNLRGEPTIRQAIEFVPATPLEYLERWALCNEVFEDDVRLASVVKWPDGALSFGITQPQYHGVPAEPRDIERFFLAAGWVRLKDPSGHLAFFNYAFQVLVIDAERRNCYITQGELQPFDVILCRPGPELEEFLCIYPS
jgi:hypothetical protein